MRYRPFGDEQLTRIAQYLVAVQAVGDKVSWADLREREEQVELSDEQRKAQLDSMFGVRR